MQYLKDIENRYLQAIEDDDLEYAELMLKEYAKYCMKDNKAIDYKGYPIIVYKAHDGDVACGYFTSDREFAEYYGSGSMNVKQYFLYMKNPYEYDFMYAGSDGDFPGDDGITRTTSQVIEDADEDVRQKGVKPYDGYILKDVGEYSSYGNAIDDYIVNNPSQVISAEPVIYDHDGNIVTLEKRFNNIYMNESFRTRILKAIHKGLFEALELDDDIVKQEAPVFKKIENSNAWSIATMQLKAYGIYTLCNYEFKCQAFDRIFFWDQKKEGNYSYVTSDDYLEIHYREGTFDVVHMNFANAAEFYKWKVYAKKDMERFIEEFPHCKEVVDHMKPVFAYVTADKALAIIDNDAYILIMPTYEVTFPNNLDAMYGNAPEIDFKSPLVKMLTKLKFSMNNVINKWHLLPRKDMDDHLVFQLLVPKSFANYMGISDIKTKILLNANFEILQNSSDTQLTANGKGEFDGLKIWIQLEPDYFCSIQYIPPKKRK